MVLPDDPDEGKELARRRSNGDPHPRSDMERIRPEKSFSATPKWTFSARQRPASRTTRRSVALTTAVPAPPRPR